MRTPIIAGNWKMYKTVADTVKYVKEFRGMVKDVADVEIVIAPPFTALHAAAEAARNSNVIVAAQDLYWEREGAFTGQVSAQMVREAGAEYVIIGHSERRTLFGETDTQVNQKTVAAFGAGLTPIVCIGETLDQRDRNETLAVLDRQIKQGLEGLTGEQLALLVVAYEPVWAIGTGRTATPAQAQEAHAALRAQLTERDAGAAQAVRILYGGSVKPANAAELFMQPDIDGGLIGGASLIAADFAAICAAARAPARR
jgi:triosephosphate isomerase